MKKNRILFFACCLALGGCTTDLYAQRTMDKLGRGLVATVTQSGSGNFVSWRVLGEEYYDVTYNLYADGVLVAKGLSASNYVHTGGTAETRYTVAPVVKGKEGEQCDPITRFTEFSFYSLTGQNTGFLRVPGAEMKGRNGEDLTENYMFNDAVLADVDGDGMPEIIAKRLYTGTPGVTDVANTSAYNRIEVYNVKGERLWYIDIGPNMQSGPDEQFDAVAFDWDEDGRAEVLMRGADNMIVHHPDGTVTEVGNMSHDIRKINNTEYSMPDNEYLLYMEGATGKLYEIGENGEKWMLYPCKRLEPGETDWTAAWGDGTGHRATKHYFGAPYLDGRHPSIFVGRGCYTRHKFYTFDVDPATHKLTERWNWVCSVGGPWFGQGYHNFGVADVDMDGRDEIVFGSMIIDDNGKGLSTTGLGHGDAQHCADLDPYRFGQEMFACNETSPAMNYRNATTSELYYRLQSTSDDGRALAGKFYKDYPGCQGASSQSGVISLTADKPLPDVAGWDLNFRIYWDGDLCEEVLNSPGTARQPKIDKPGVGRIFLGSGAMNNGTKNNPCATGDLFGDWREELLVRDGKDLLIYTTNYPTDFRIPTLWHDHQYRQGMVWETIGYNQPPHLSYFLGELEGITVAPPPLTTEGRTQIANGGNITTAHNGSQVLVFDNADTQVAVESGAEPWVAVFNVPSWVKGTAPSDCTTKDVPIDYDYYTCTVTGSGFSGATRLVKQGEGTLVLPDVEMTHRGNTDVWNGTLVFNGTMKQSSLWLNRHTSLRSAGTFRSIKADYNATVYPGGDGQVGTITTDSATLGFGSRVVFDLKNDFTSDRLDAKVLTVETKSWKYGPKYLAPVFEFRGEDVQPGRYPIGTAAMVKGELSSILIEGISSQMSARLVLEDGTLYLTLSDVRAASDVVWNGLNSNIWDFGQSENFTLAEEAGPVFFVTGDRVLFDDTAERRSVSLSGSIEAESVTVDNTLNYAFSGTGALAGHTALVKRGSGMLTISNDNTYTGGTRISGGTVSVNMLSNSTRAYGGLGGVVESADLFVIENGATLRTTETVTQGSPMKMEGEDGGCVENLKDFIIETPVEGTLLTKKGDGWMKLNTACPSLERLALDGGTVQCVACDKPARTVEFRSGTLYENTGSSYAIHVPEGGSGTWSLANRSTYTNKITGEGTLTIYCAVEHGNGWFATRTPVAVNLAQFTGTINATADMADTYPRFTLNTSSGMPDGTLNITEGVTVQNTGRTFRIGKLAGKGALGGYASFANDGATGVNTWQVGCDDDFTWAGTVTANSKFEKVGSGKMTVSGVWDNTGEVAVKEGTLCLNDRSAENAMLGSGELSVEDGAVLCGLGKLGNASVTVERGGRLYSGTREGASSGALDFSGKRLTVSAGGEVMFNVASKVRCTTLEGISSFSLRGTLKVSVRERLELEAGDEFQLWTANRTVLSSACTLDLDSPGEGLEWDTSALEDGVLKVKTATGITGVVSGEPVDCVVYTLDGARAGYFTCMPSEVRAYMEENGFKPGMYMVKMTQGQRTVSRKVTVD